MNKLFILSFAVAIQGCMSLSVKGQMQNSAETFTGTVTNEVSGGGILKLISSKGVVCEGEVDYEEYDVGRGNLSCDDGRSGPFDFAGTGSKGTGQGSLGKESFSFSYGFKAVTQEERKVPKENEKGEADD